MSDLQVVIIIVLILAALILILKKLRYKSPTIGALAGFAIWLADYDFLLNFGGPETAISDWVCDLFSVKPWQIDTKAFLSLFFLMFVGALVCSLGLVLEVPRKRK
jgi:hypothetical protein